MPEITALDKVNARRLCFVLEKNCRSLMRERMLYVIQTDEEMNSTFKQIVFDVCENYRQAGVFHAFRAESEVIDKNKFVGNVWIKYRRFDSDPIQITLRMNRNDGFLNELKQRNNKLKQRDNTSLLPSASDMYGKLMQWFIR